VLLAVCEYFIGERLSRLHEFKTRFELEGSKLGLAQNGLRSVWEKCVQSIYVLATAPGASTIPALRIKMEHLPHGIDENAGIKLFAEEYGVHFNTVEMKAFLLCFSSDTGVVLPFAEDLSRALRSLSNCLDEIVLYGHFQQLVFTLSKILVEEPTGRISFEELGRLKFLHPKGVPPASKALLTGYASPRNYVDTRLIRALNSCLLQLSETGTMSIQNLSSLLKELEEVVACLSTKARALKLQDAVVESSRSWLYQSCEEVVTGIADAKVLEGIACVCMMYHRLCSNASVLITRVVLFLKYVMEGFGINIAKDEALLDSELSVIESEQRLKIRVAVTQLFDCTLRTLLMFYYGEEVTCCTYGSYYTSHQSCFPSLTFPPFMKNTLVECRWSSQLTCLFEPLLIQLLTESGTGNKKFTTAIDLLTQNHSHITNLHNIRCHDNIPRLYALL
jgi:hypothetical protein